jgi:hypothetical protein
MAIIIASEGLTMPISGLLGDNSAMQTIRARVAFHTRQHGFDRAAKQLVAGSNVAATDRLVADLFAYWGDPLQQSDERFMRSCLAEARVADGPILQCGTSLTTLVLGAICDQSPEQKKQLWCLEQDSHWANLMRSWLTEYQVGSAHVIHSRARLFNDYVWYSLDPNRLAKKYQLVICDGGRATVQGAIGAISRLHRRFAEKFVILIRNVTSQTDMKHLATWARTQNAACVLIDKTEGFVKIASKDMTPPPETRNGAQALKTGR